MVRIRFLSSVADYIRERRWHPSQEITECEHGDIILSLTVNYLLELKRWVLSWGDSAVVFEPLSLRNDVRNTLRSAGERYGPE